MMITWVSLSATPVGLYDVGSVISSSTTLALAAIGQTIVVLSGGFDLSASAVVSLSNVLAVRFVQGTPIEQWGGVALILAIGGGIGLINGALIAWFRLQSIVVTLATMFMVQGLTLLIQNKPGGSIGDQFGGFHHLGSRARQSPHVSRRAGRRAARVDLRQTYALRRGPLCARQRPRRRLRERHACAGLPDRDLCARRHVLRGSGACMYRRRPVPPIRSWAGRCCSPCSPLSCWAARGWVADAAVASARCSPP